MSLVSTAAVSSCGKESPARAIYETALELEHQDARGSATACSQHAAAGRERRSVCPTGAHPRTTLWDGERAKCVRELGHAGDYASFSYEEPRVRTIQAVIVTARGGITAATWARVALRGDPPKTVNLVEFGCVSRVAVTLHSNA